MLKGSCLCGAIQYEYDGTISEISRCHCRQCQKGQGTAFVAVAPLDDKKLTFVSGDKYIKEFRATENKVRAFCSECGSPLYSARDDLPGVKRLRIGTLDSDVNTPNQYHAFVKYKASWDEICDDYPQFDELPK